MELTFGLGLYVIAVEPGANRRLDEQLRGRSGRQGDEGSTRLYGSLADDVLRFYGDAGVRARALRGLAQTRVLEGRPAARVIEDAQKRAESVHEGQRRELYEFDQVLEAQRRAMLDSYERALEHAAPDAVVHGFITEIADGEQARRPVDPAALAAWRADMFARYGIPRDATAPGAGEAEGEGAGDHSPALPPFLPSADDLARAMGDRWQRARAEAGERWPEVVRAALLQTASELWAVHVDSTGHLQQQAPALFAFLPGAATIPYAREASHRYDEYLWQVRAETLSTLLTLPQRYERPLAPADVPPPSPAAEALLQHIERNTRDGTAGRAGA